MKKKWALRITATFILIILLLAGIILRPTLLYAGHTAAGRYMVYHQQRLEAQFFSRLSSADSLLRASPLYNTHVALSVCLNDGSVYPKLVEAIKGKAFAHGLEHKIIFTCAIDAQNNLALLNGYSWNLTELLAHEATHCLQYSRYGALKASPLSGIPMWKWEGYPEYVSRKKKAGLYGNIRHLLATEQTDNNNWIRFADSTGTVIPYYKAWLLVQYCLDIKHQTYDELLNDTTRERIVTAEMMTWYNRNKYVDTSFLH